MPYKHDEPLIKESSPCIGIIGGVGPFAGLDFVQKILKNTQAVQDQDHINCILISCPSLIPDRTQFLLQKKTQEGENPALGLFESARRLHLAGANLAVVACNTTHADRIFKVFSDMVRESLPGLRIINMLETCAAYMKESVYRNLGLLATKGTYISGVYHEYFKKEEGFLLIEPDISGQENIHEAIYNKNFGIKAYSQPVTLQAANLLNSEIQRLIDKGAEAVILGCTELPLATQNQNYPVTVIDPGLLTARRLISIAAPEKLLSE